MNVAWGNVPASSVLPFFFHTFDSTGASVTISSFAVGDILVYKGTSMTQRSSTAGFTLLDTDGIDLDGTTGIQGFSIDLSDNTDAGFYAVGSFYTVVVGPITINTKTVNFVAGTFRIIAAENTAGFQAVDAAKWNNLATVELPLVPTTAGRKLDVSAGGEAGVDWANVGSPTTAVDLSNTTIKTTQKVDVDTIKTNPVANGGTVTFPTNATLASTTNITAAAGCAVSSLGANVITAAATATDFGDEIASAIWKDTTAGDFTAANSIGKSIMNGVSLGTGLTVAAVSGAVGSVTGAVGSVTGAVGSVTGNVGGNVVGTVASVVGAVGSVTGNVGGNVVGSVASVTADVNVTSNINKNAASRITFVMTDSTTHAPKTGVTVTAQRSLDGGALASCANSVTEIGSGLYTLVLAAADTNADELCYRFTGTGADDLIIERVTQP
jgi:hypothetical protein